ncbi:hypothetical protein [Maridesulfovibrio sp.]|uniref:hypothetical protein n=1 Tax=Maridesulfovibrio sp. TaxID=2795000 RepID=UPI003BA94378
MKILIEGADPVETVISLSSVAKDIAKAMTSAENPELLLDTLLAMLTSVVEAAEVLER